MVDFLAKLGIRHAQVTPQCRDRTMAVALRIIELQLTAYRTEMLELVSVTKPCELL